MPSDEDEVSCLGKDLDGTGEPEGEGTMGGIT